MTYVCSFANAGGMSCMAITISYASSTWPYGNKQNLVLFFQLMTKMLRCRYKSILDVASSA